MSRNNKTSRIRKASRKTEIRTEKRKEKWEEWLE